MDFDGVTLAFNITRPLITVPEKPGNPKHFHKTQTVSRKPKQFQKRKEKTLRKPKTLPENQNTSGIVETKTPPES